MDAYVFKQQALGKTSGYGMQLVWQTREDISAEILALISVYDPAKQR
jgi:hypothetical protein